MVKTDSTSIMKKYLTQGQHLAYLAGEKLLRRQKRLDRLKITHKEAQGVMSQADRESEDFLLSSLKRQWVGHQFLAEETAFDQFKGVIQAYEHFRNQKDLWIIDPLDGTHNFLNGSDYFSISIAFVSKGRSLVGLVYRPSTGECFYAIKGQGAKFCNLKTSGRSKKILFREKSKNLSDAIFVTGFVAEKGQFEQDEFIQFEQTMRNCRGVRRFGSAALDICYVSSGLWDGFWERKLAPWDVAAAGLIAMEAGLKVTNYQKELFSPFHESIAVFSPALHKQYFSMISQN